jgi:hypothetical protein
LWFFVTFVAKVLGFRDFATHCRCTLSQDPTPHKAFVENKHQSAIRPTDDRTVEVPFRCFSASESCLFESHHLTLGFTQLQWNQHALQYPSSHRLRASAEGHNPKMKKPDNWVSCKLIHYRVSASSDSLCESRAFRQTFIALAMNPAIPTSSQSKIKNCGPQSLS